MRATKAVSLGMALVAVVAGAWLGVLSGKAPAPIVATSQPGETAGPRDLVIHVSGWVVTPGVVTVQEGAIVAEAIDATGGAKPGAALDRINLSREVVEGELIEVPGPNADARRTGSTVDGLISLNRAAVSELVSLPGVGQVLAERIVAYREDNGPFETIEDLLDVSGIGEAKLASIRDLVVVP